MRGVAAFLSLTSAVIGLVGTVVWNIRAHRDYGTERDPRGNIIGTRKEPVVKKAMRLTISAMVGLVVVTALAMVMIIMVRQTLELSG